MSSLKSRDQIPCLPVAQDGREPPLPHSLWSKKYRMFPFWSFKPYKIYVNIPIRITCTVEKNDYTYFTIQKQEKHTEQEFYVL